MTYSWTSDDQDCLFYEDEDGKSLAIPTDPNNRHYAQFLASGVTANEYVAPPAPPAPPEPTAEEKLASAGLTVEELQTLLGL